MGIDNISVLKENTMALNSPTNKRAPKKSAAKKTAPKKTAAKKTSARKSTAKKSTARKSTTRKAAAPKKVSKATTDFADIARVKNSRYGSGRERDELAKMQGLDPAEVRAEMHRLRVEDLNQ